MKRITALLTCIMLTMALALNGQEAMESASKDMGLRVHSLFQSHMVIQRDKPVVVWGWAAPGNVVTVTFGGEQGKATAAKDGLWRVSLPAMAANPEPQQMTVVDKSRTVTLDNVLVGDVWIIGGQSNMQHPLSRTEGGSVEIISANLPEIRLLTVPPVIDNTVKVNFPRRQKDKQPDGDWDVCSPKTVREFSAIGYAFVRRIHMASQVPIGAVDVSRWGTTVEAWTPYAVLESMNSDVVNVQLKQWRQKVETYDPHKDLESRVKRYKQRMASQNKEASNPPTDLRPSPKHGQNFPGNCYNSFIAPIAGLAVKGAIYHQGYNNSRPDAAGFYYQVFPKMIASWRAAFNDPAMAFGIISLCTDTPPQTLDNYVESMLNLGIYVREAHYKTFLDFHKAGDTNVGFASSFDLRRAWFHPQHKIPAGERIARWALATYYGFENSAYWKPPMLVKMEAEGGKLILHLDKDVGPEETGAEIVGFAISGKDKKFQPARAEFLVIGKDSRNRPKTDRKVIVLSSPHVPDPIHFRYAWARNPMGNLRAWGNQVKDVPFATQRSDTWEFWEVPYLEPPADKGESKESRAKIREVLSFIDLERRVKDAERLLDKEKGRYEEQKKALLKD